MSKVDSKASSMSAKRRRGNSDTETVPPASRTNDVVEKTEEDADETLTSTTSEASLADAKVSPMKRLRISSKNDDDLVEDTEAVTAEAQVPEMAGSSDKLEAREKEEKEEMEEDGENKETPEEKDEESQSTPGKRVFGSGYSSGLGFGAFKNINSSSDSASSSTEKVDESKEEESQPAPAKRVFGSGYSSGLGFGSFSSSGGFANAAKVSSPFAAYAGTDAGFAQHAATASKSPDTSTAADTPACDEADKPAADSKTFDDMLREGSNESLVTKVIEPTAVVSKHADAKTSEKDEKCVFLTRGKLYEFKDKDWRECGTGQFKILQDKINENDWLLGMWRDGSQAQILSAKLIPGMKVTCNRKTVSFSRLLGDGITMVPYSLRVGSEDEAQNVVDSIIGYIPSQVDNASKAEEAQESGSDNKSTGQPDTEEAEEATGTDKSSDNGAEDSEASAEH